ncbi:unnamed protein product [Cladocopium goreaui]|uniref:DUF4460 domain-containing protein n=1 Tax=Cladocopium goreaui TaxID=2562237 RepID=A0A9P1CUS5_9DINO|nr:unnamed protein product [Cladocopium goreaui]
MRISISEFIHLGCVLVAAAQSCVSPEQKPVVLLQTATANGRSQAAGRASSVAASIGPHAAATSALAFAERLFAPDHSLLQQANIDSLGNNVLAPVIVAVSAALLSCGIVVCLITYQPKPEYSQEEETALRSNIDAHNRHVREKQACAC